MTVSYTYNVSGALADESQALLLTHAARYLAAQH
jgi:hypothetical protein